MSNKPIPLVDLAAQWAEIEDEAMPLVQARLRSGDYLGHDAIAAFEAEWAAYVGGGVHAVACSSGTDAVELMVRVCTPEGAEVGVDEDTFVATVAGVERAGRTTVLNHERLALGGYSISTWLYGSTAYGAAKARECRERGTVLLEDASQAHGNKSAGTFGDAAAWSLYPSKNLGGIGQGGVVTFKDSVAAARARRIREHGYDRATDRHWGRGWNLRMDAINADVLRVKLRHLDRWTARRRSIAAVYCAELAALHDKTAIELPFIDSDHAVHLFVIRVNNGWVPGYLTRDRVLARLRERGVMAQVHYRTTADGRETEWSRSVISLPCHAHMTESQVSRVIEAVKESVK